MVVPKLKEVSIFVYILGLQRTISFEMCFSWKYILICLYYTIISTSNNYSTVVMHVWIPDKEQEQFLDNC